jgi:hypothetical protein
MEKVMTRVQCHKLQRNGLMIGTSSTYYCSSFFSKKSSLQAYEYSTLATAAAKEIVKDNGVET